jgi:hypothetical protein
MKKTIRTVLTAAMFASANLAAIPSSAAGETNQQPEQPTKAEALSELTDTRKPMPIYGPPEVMRTLTTAPPEELVTTTTTYTQQVYGPPWMLTTTSVQTVYGPPWMFTTVTTQPVPQPAYGPPIMLGDLNLDYVVDSFDAITLRKAILEDSSDYMQLYNGDLNNDGRLTVGDLVLLNKYLLGIIKDLRNFDNNSEYIATTVADKSVETTTTTTYDPRNDLIVTLYGIAPIKDVVMDIRGDVENSVDALTDDNNTPSQEK